jgi:hypothetical protein
MPYLVWCKQIRLSGSTDWHHKASSAQRKITVALSPRVAQMRLGGCFPASRVTTIARVRHWQSLNPDGNLFPYGELV